MNQLLYDALQIRYIKLNITITFLENTLLPKNKVSALRGGMGEMLLQMNCIRDRDCENCDFEKHCIVQKIMYSKYEIKPVFITECASIGYIFECENFQEKFFAGETLQFQLILFGKMLVYFNQFMQAFTMLGVVGLGKEKARFHICSVKNEQNQTIVGSDELKLENYRIRIINDYVEYRMKQIMQRGLHNRLIFHTPTTIKYQNEYMQSFQIHPLAEALKRRIYMLNCYEGIENNLQEFEPALPEVLGQEHIFSTVKRYSNRKNAHMELKGIRGYMQMGVIAEDLLALLLAGELVHVGKHTSFGFGRYTVR